VLIEKGFYFKKMRGEGTGLQSNGRQGAARYK
jgi:hypothetical protein